MNQNDEYCTFIVNLISILSFAVGLQNLDMNNKQVTELEDHLKKQDEQYSEIIKLLKEGTIPMKGD